MVQASACPDLLLPEATRDQCIADLPSAPSRFVQLLPSPASCVRRKNPKQCYRPCQGRPLCLNRTVNVEELRPIWKVGKAPGGRWLECEQFLVLATAAGINCRHAMAGCAWLCRNLCPCPFNLV